VLRSSGNCSRCAWQKHGTPPPAVRVACGCVLLRGALPREDLRADWDNARDRDAPASIFPSTPRPQFVFHIHYHKTGNQITYQYGGAVKLAGRPNANETTQDAGGSTPWTITNQMVRRIPPIHSDKRTHHHATGCPVLGDFPPRPRSAPAPGARDGTAGPGRIHLVYLPAPDFFCDLHAHDAFLQRRAGSGTAASSPVVGRRHDVKFVHMLRDPFGALRCRPRMSIRAPPGVTRQSTPVCFIL